MKEINGFINKLSTANKIPSTINLYKGEKRHSRIRRNNLRLYLIKMKEISPTVLLLGEAPGYKGCRLTGIPFTSERILASNPLFSDGKYQFISKKKYETESSATMVWGELQKYSSIPLIWNIFPFHPYKTKNPKSNRTPTPMELVIGKEFVKELLKIYKIKKIIAIGRLPLSQIADLEIKYVGIRHPANGGKKGFADGLKNILK